ncbi:MAG: sulfotransferase [Planctomycetota bacterium]
MIGPIDVMHSAILRWHILTGGLRCAPDFLLIGAQRSGSTSLFEAIASHPRVMRPRMKELHNLDERDASRARARVGLPLVVSRAATSVLSGSRKLTGEATPMYLFHPEVPARTAHLFPEAKLIAVLRHPMDRAWSHYRHSVRLGFESEPFERALDLEGARLGAAPVRTLPGRRDELWPLRDWSYASRGRYSEQLERWRRHVDPSQMLVLYFDDLVSDPAGPIDRICSFLGLEPSPAVTLRRLNAGPERAEPPASARRRFAALVEQEVVALERLLGVVPAWSV